eukprot:CAMPEP_0206423212 /NCGR_PEP_ID=MMETSP0324_2-20121206/2555_1 /ASSEMBLY_ACC=CAM_ASM_000836 /TAXON_ID=2866 /ORGANISM="Crypthecodinium cohnii, Strain Seligo" /LENGTH=63 /DNA_ID=CAMNT_0053887747 /DNA_START=438 /DNA_END=629 /DNA_ORIENTATION=-
MVAPTSDHLGEKVPSVGPTNGGCTSRHRDDAMSMAGLAMQAQLHSAAQIGQNKIISKPAEARL